MKPLIVGRRVFLEYLVRKEPKKVLTVVCKSVVVPRLFLRHVILPHLVFLVVDDESSVLPTTMFDMPRKPHPSSSAGIMLLFDAQRDLRLQSLYPSSCARVREQLFP